MAVFERGGVSPSLVQVRAGNPLLTRRLLACHNQGDLRLESVSGPTTRGGRVTVAPCSLFCSTEGVGEYEMDPYLVQAGPKNVIAATRRRVLQGLIRVRAGGRPSRQARIPPSCDEITPGIIDRFATD